MHAAARRHEVGIEQQSFKKLQVHQVVSVVERLGSSKARLRAPARFARNAGYGDCCGYAHEAERSLSEGVGN